MARKLSRIARHDFYLVAIASVSLTAVNVRAEDGIKVSPAPPKLVQNPFVASDSANIPVRPQPRRGTNIYQNPFATDSAAPPIETPLLPGPVSRWQRSVTPLVGFSPVKTTIWSTDPIEHGQVPWDQLPPTEHLRSRVAAQSASTEPSTSVDFADPPDPVRFAPEPLAQPAWLTVDGNAVSPPSSIGQASFDQPLASDSLGSPASNTLYVTSPDADVPFVISDYVDPPEGWLAQAQKAAHAAQSVDDLSTVVDLCERGLNAELPIELAASLRRLAAWAHNRRGELLAEADRQQEAINDFQAAVSLDPRCSLAIHNRGVSLAEKNEFAAALRDFNTVIELNPGLAVAYRNRAELLAASGQMTYAVVDFTRAIETIPDDAELYRARGYAFQRLGAFDRAQADLDRAIQLTPHDAETLTQRGNLAAERGDFKQALDDLRQALAIEPDLAKAHRSLAWLHATCPDERYRDSEKALAAAQSAAKASPQNDYLIFDTLAAAHASARQFDEAVFAQQQAIAVAPADVAEPLRQRLGSYQQRKPFRSGPASSSR